MLTQKPFTAWRVVGLTPLTGGGERLILPSMSHSNNSRRSKNICIFFRNHPSRPYSQGVFAFHNTELLLYTFMQGKGCYFFLITLHLSSRFYSLFTEKQVKKELEAFQKGNSTSSPWHWGSPKVSVKYAHGPLINLLMNVFAVCMRHLVYIQTWQKRWIHKLCSKSQQVTWKGQCQIHLSRYRRVSRKSVGDVGFEPASIRAVLTGLPLQ